MMQYDEENDRLPQQDSPRDSANLSNYISDQTLVEDKQEEQIIMTSNNNQPAGASSLAGGVTAASSQNVERLKNNQALP